MVGAVVRWASHSHAWGTSYYCLESSRGRSVGRLSRGFVFLGFTVALLRYGRRLQSVGRAMTARRARVMTLGTGLVPPVSRACSSAQRASTCGMAVPRRRNAVVPVRRGIRPLVKSSVARAVAISYLTLFGAFRSSVSVVGHALNEQLGCGRLSWCSHSSTGGLIAAALVRSRTPKSDRALAGRRSRRVCRQDRRWRHTRDRHRAVRAHHVLNGFVFV